MEVRFKSPAKINWTLAVKRRRQDGYHEIDTVMQTVSLYDELIIVARRRPICLVICDDENVPTGRGNLIYRAWKLIRDAYPKRVGGIVVDLMKSIPMGAGLGGGSSNAAATLMAVSLLYGLRLPRKRLEAMAAELGSDVPFFIRGGTTRARGRGERLERLRSRMRPLHLVIVWPGFQSPTASAYAALSPADFTRRSTAPKAVDALSRGWKQPLIDAMQNSFEPVLEPADVRYAAAREALNAQGLQRPMLAGSGAALFAVARNRAHAAAATAALAARYPFTFPVQTIRTGARQIEW